MRNILCLSVVILASIVAVINAAPATKESRADIPIPAIPLDNNQDVGTFDEMFFDKTLQMMDNLNPGPDEMANPPLQNYRVRDIQRLSYQNLAKFYTELVKYKIKTDPDANIDAYMNQLATAFDQARAPGTLYTDNVIFSIILNYRSFGYRLEPEPVRFLSFQQALQDMYLPTLSAADAKDVRRIILSLGNTYY